MIFRGLYFFLILLLVLPGAEVLRAQELPTLIPYRKGDKWGFSDKNKRIVIKPQYDEVEFFSEGLAAVRKGIYWGYIDNSGHLVVPAKYHTASEFFPNGLARVSVLEKRKKQDGNTESSSGCKKVMQEVSDPVISPSFKDVIIKSSPCIIEYYYLVDKKGKQVYRLDYETRYPDGKRNYYSEKKGGIWEKRDFADTVKKTKLPYDMVHPVSEGYHVVMKDSRYGLADTSGNIKIPLKYEYVSDVSNGIAVAQAEHKYIVFEASGKELFIYDKGFLLGSLHDGLILVRENLGNSSQFANRDFYGYLDRNGAYKVKPVYKNATPFYKKFAIVKDSVTGQVFYITTNNEKVPNKFQWDIPVPCCTDDLDSLGNIIQENGLLKVEKKGHANPNDIIAGAKFTYKKQFGFIDGSGNEIIPMIYDNAGRFHSGVCKVVKDGKSGIIDGSGKVIGKLRYDEVHVPSIYDCPNMIYSYHTFLDHYPNEFIWSKGLIKVIVNNKVGLIDFNGNEYFEEPPGKSLPSR